MRRSKKALIHEYLARERPEMVGPAQAAAIRRELQKALGARGRISDRYLLAVLEESGTPVDRALGGLDPELAALVRFDTLAGAEAALGQLEDRRRRARAAGDRRAAEECRQAARRAREHAEMVARSRRVHPAVRREREEAARWFAVWLETPDLFADWLELRKKSPEFRDRFAV